MKKKIFAITVSVLTFLSSLGSASKLEKDELNEVVALANSLGVYDCYDFEGAYSHPEMNQVYTVDAHLIYRVVCMKAASNAVNKWLKRDCERLTAHCLRHTMRDRLRAVECPMDMIDQIGGWKSVSGIGVSYGRGYGLEQQKGWLAMVMLDGYDRP